MASRGSGYARRISTASFQDKSITAVVRAGDRVSKPDYRTLVVGQEYPVRFIKRPGMGHDVPAELFQDDGTTVRITEGFVRMLAYLTEKDLIGMAPDQATPELVRYHLAIVNNTTIPAWNEFVTIWRFEHLPNAT